MKVIEITFVGYPVTDLRRARTFYEQTLGLTVSRVFGEDLTGWIEYDLGANTLAIGNTSPDWKTVCGRRISSAGSRRHVSGRFPLNGLKPSSPGGSPYPSPGEEMSHEAHFRKTGGRQSRRNEADTQTRSS